MPLVRSENLPTSHPKKRGVLALIPEMTASSRDSIGMLTSSEGISVNFVANEKQAKEEQAGSSERIYGAGKEEERVEGEK